MRMIVDVSHRQKEATREIMAFNNRHTSSTTIYNHSLLQFLINPTLPLTLYTDSFQSITPMFREFTWSSESPCSGTTNISPDFEGSIGGPCLYVMLLVIAFFSVQGMGNSDTNVTTQTSINMGSSINTGSLINFAVNCLTIGSLYRLQV